MKKTNYLPIADTEQACNSKHENTTLFFLQSQYRIQYMSQIQPANHNSVTTAFLNAKHLQKL
jgi:two-component sensor histidine kinase